MQSSSPLRTPKSQLLNNHQQEDVGTHQKTNKQTKNPCLRAKEKPQQDGRRGAITKK